MNGNVNNTDFIKRASGASEAFSLVMKINNCLRKRVLTRTLPPRRLSPSPLGCAHKKSCAYHPVFKSTWIVTVVSAFKSWSQAKLKKAKLENESQKSVDDKLL